MIDLHVGNNVLVNLHSSDLLFSPSPPPPRPIHLNMIIHVIHEFERRKGKGRTTKKSDHGLNKLARAHSNGGNPSIRSPVRGQWPVEQDRRSTLRKSSSSSRSATGGGQVSPKQVTSLSDFNVFPAFGIGYVVLTSFQWLERLVKFTSTRLDRHASFYSHGKADGVN